MSNIIQGNVSSWKIRWQSEVSKEIYFCIYKNIHLELYIHARPAGTALICKIYECKSYFFEQFQDLQVSWIFIYSLYAETFDKFNDTYFPSFVTNYLEGNQRVYTRNPRISLNKTWIFSVMPYSQNVFSKVGLD